jgi:hypothetical protein
LAAQTPRSLRAGWVRMSTLAQLGRSAIANTVDPTDSTIVNMRGWQLSNAIVILLTLWSYGCGDGNPPTPSLNPFLVDPISATVEVSTTQQFTTGIIGATWWVDGTLGGSSTKGLISPSGLYTAPNPTPTNPVVTITAHSGSISGTATVTISADRLLWQEQRGLSRCFPPAIWLTPERSQPPYPASVRGDISGGCTGCSCLPRISRFTVFALVLPPRLARRRLSSRPPSFRMQFGVSIFRPFKQYLLY